MSAERRLLLAGLLALVACGESPPPSPSLAESSPQVRPPQRLEVTEIDDLLWRLEADLAVVQAVDAIDAESSRYRLQRLQAALQAARAMAVENRFNQNAVRKYRLIRARYLAGDFSPLPAENDWQQTQRAAFDLWIAEQERGFGEHDSDHLPWLQDKE